NMPEKKKFNFKYLLKVIVYICALLVAIYLVLLASGYKFDSRNKNFKQTGSIYINSNPKDVKIYINGKLKSTRTPLKLGYLLPENYQVRIEKDGFQKWEKNLTVKPGLVSSESEVILFYDKARQEEFSNIEGVKNFKINAAKNELLFWTTNQIYFQKTDSNQNQKSAELLTSQIEDVDGGLNFKRLLIKGKDLTSQGQIMLYCSQGDCPEPYDLDHGLSLNFDKGKVNDDDSYPLLLSAQGNLYSVTDKLVKYYIDSNVLDFVLFSGKIFYLTNDENGVKISSSDPKGEDKKLITAQKANESEKKNFALYVDAKKNRLFLISRDNDLFRINTGNQTLEEIKTEATSLNFDNNNFLLIINGSELKVQGKVKVTDEEKSLHEVARYSSDPLNPGWIFRTNHLLLIRDRILKTVEVEGSNETDLYAFNNDDYTKDKTGNLNFVSISKNEAVVLDKMKLKKVTFCERGSLIDLWQ
ncbi:MAG: PEGA domain-containing protein, partial [Candidatus Berkelbacteria bacterium]|nr:PEGA domain-containing protein [Candidatus Berkelbacteria bacterium]